MRKSVFLMGRPAAFGRWLLVLTMLLMGAQSLGAQDRGPAGGSQLSYLPHVSVGLPTLTLNPIGRPNSSNQWTVSWNGVMAAPSYELQESHDADFSVVTTYQVTTTSHLIQQPLSFHNIFYYRVRALGGGDTGLWSNVESVMGGYRDDFNDASSGWAMRRTTYLERVLGIYNKNGTYGILSTDGFDWGIFSPLRPAPPVPYAIEYHAGLENLNWPLASHGAVFGGDWTGEPCPDYSSVQGIYEHNICFNQFYNATLLWYYGQGSVLRMVLERIDLLYWCPKCGGSPMKRLSNDEDLWAIVDPVPNAEPKGWNTWRAEVRSDGIKLFVNGYHYATMADSTYVHEPYFGLFVGTGTGEVSSWLVDYYQVTYLDN